MRARCLTRNAADGLGGDLDDGGVGVGRPPRIRVVLLHLGAAQPADALDARAHLEAGRVATAGHRAGSAVRGPSCKRAGASAAVTTLHRHRPPTCSSGGIRLLRVEHCTANTAWLSPGRCCGLMDARLVEVSTRPERRGVAGRREWVRAAAGSTSERQRSGGTRHARRLKRGTRQHEQQYNARRLKGGTRQHEQQCTALPHLAPRGSSSARRAAA